MVLKGVTPTPFHTVDFGSFVHASIPDEDVPEYKIHAI